MRKMIISTRNIIQQLSDIRRKFNEFNRKEKGACKYKRNCSRRTFKDNHKKGSKEKRVKICYRISANVKEVKQRMRAPIKNTSAELEEKP